MQNAKATLKREKTSRMQVLEYGCNMEWYKCLRDILQQNSRNSYVYGDPTRDLLIHVRGKFRNFMITDLANCGKLSC